MSRQLTSGSTLENLKREAKRWLKALRAHEGDAHARLVRAYPDAPAAPGLRDVQHALAREYGFTGWAALKREVQEIEARRGGDARALAVTQLLEAAVRGDVARVNALLDERPEVVNERAVISGHSGLRTALHHAVEHRDMVACLLERGADPNVRDEGDNAMPLHFAAEREDLAVIRLLIEHGADPIGAGDDHQLEVIGWATVFGKGDAEVVSYLLEHGARHNIYSAVATGAGDVIRALAAESRADIDRPMDRTNHHRAPLHLAVVKKRPESLAALLELGVQTEVFDAAGLTPLDQAALDAQSGMVQQLLDHGAHLHLPAAIALGRIADVERLLRGDPDVLKPGQRRGTLIVRASESASAEVIHALIRAGAFVNVRDDTTTSIDRTSGYTPLHAAAFHGNAAAAEALLEHGADPNVRDGRYCSPPAGWAEYAGHTTLRDRILEARIDVFQAIDFDLPHRIPGIVQRDPWLLEARFRDYGTCEGEDPSHPEPWHTPLIWAVVQNKVDAVRTLLEQGAMQPIATTHGHRTLIDIARGAGNEEVARLLQLHQRVEQTHEGRVRWFVKNACPDHDIRGATDHVVAHHTAERLLRRHPEIARDSFYTAVICGDVAEVERVLAKRPEAANEKGGPKNWEPLLYLCFTRLPSVAAANEKAVTIARLMLDHGADPNVYFMAGDSRYTPLVGAIGEGEEDRPPHARRDELVRLLLERGAEPYDLQVLYNIHFHGRVLWFLERIYDHSMKLGRRADWEDPEWRMLDMGGYGTGARYLLEIAVRHDDAALAEWLLSHGANPDSPPPRDPRSAKISLYEAAVRRGHMGIAELLLRYGATTAGTLPRPEGEEAFVAACLQRDQDRARTMAERHPEYLQSAKAIIAAAEKDRADVVAFLLDVGVPIEVANEQQQRPMHAAAWNNALRVAELLIERGAEIDPREAEWGNTPLDFAVHFHHKPMIDLLGRHSRDIWNLVFTGKLDRMRELLREDPELAKTVTKENDTPLMWLPDDEKIAAAMVELFLKAGADAGLRSRNGLTAADYASRRGLEEAAALLRTHEGGG